MRDLKKRLEERRSYLQQIKKEKEHHLLSAPGGTLRVCCNKGRIQYYQRNKSKDIAEVYIRGKDIQLANKLAQKDYDKKVLGAVEKELKAIDRYLESYPILSAENVYTSLHWARRKLIAPIYELDEQYISNWQKVEYQGKEFQADIPEFYTAKGERVRSKSEVIIADALSREGVPYRYEYPLTLKGMGTVHPDFMVLNVRLRKEIYWEHFGMLSDGAYMENAVHKILGYEQNGFFAGDKLIFTYETKNIPLNQKQIMGIIQQYLK